MDLPSLSQGNLYRVMALAGVALLITSITYPLGKFDDINLQLADVRGQLLVLKVKRDQLRAAVEAISNTAANASDVVTRAREIDELEVLLAEREATLLKVDAALAQVSRYKKYYSVGAGIGTLLLVLGVSLWYWLVQRQQDKALHEGNTPSTPRTVARSRGTGRDDEDNTVVSADAIDWYATLRSTFVTIRELSDQEILVAVEPIMDNLMQGSTDINHAKHTRDFTDRLKCIVTPARLAAMCADYQSRIGFFGRREFVALFRRQASVAVVWKQYCSKSPDEFVAEAVFVLDGDRWLVDHAMIF
jgi:hypothetical protein